MKDVIIIGAGVIGTSIARELSRYKLNTLVIEKESDVSEGTSKANSGIVHAGYDAKYGSLKAKFNIEGSQIMESYCKELDIPYEKIGSLVVAFDDEDEETINNLYENGIKNGVKDLEIIEKEAALKMNPNLSPSVTKALYAKNAAIVGCWEFAINSMENAMDNGVDLALNTEVTGIEKINDGFKVITNNETYEGKVVVNCAGLYSDKIHNMVSKPKFTITPRRGQYFLLEKPNQPVVNQIIFPTPKGGTKGILVLPTVHGNVLVGPNAEFIDEKDDVETTSENFQEIRKNAIKTVPNLPLWTTITSFSGLRSSSDVGDFIIEEVEDVPHFIDVAGIESPGLSSAPAIGKYVKDLILEMFDKIELNSNFSPNIRKKIVLDEMNNDEINDLIKLDPTFGSLVCSCERITEGEVLDIIRRNAGATTIDGVKRRARPGAGPCQGSFCSPKIMKILASELGKDVTEINKRNSGSNIATARTK